MSTKKTDIALEKPEMVDPAMLETFTTDTTKSHTKKAKTVAKHAEAEVAETATKTVKIARIRVPKPMRQAYLASLGAVSLAQEESGAFFNKLVEQGAEAEKEGRQWLRHANKHTQHQATKASDRVEESVEAASDRVEQTVERVLAKLNVPSKTDIERLSKKITDLSLKVDELKGVNEHATEA